MEEITIYKFQLEDILDALRIAANIHNSRSETITCFDRNIVQAEQYAKNALNGNKDIHVNRYYKNKDIKDNQNIICDCGEQNFVFNEHTQELICKCGNKYKL